MINYSKVMHGCFHVQLELRLSGPMVYGGYLIFPTSTELTFFLINLHRCLTLRIARYSSEAVQAQNALNAALVP